MIPSGLEEEAEQFATQVFLPGLDVVHDSAGSGQHHEAELTRGQCLLQVTLQVLHFDVESRTDDSALDQTTGQVDDDLAGTMVVDDLKLANVAMFHHHSQELDDDLGRRTNQDLTLAGLLRIVDAFQGVCQHVHAHHFASGWCVCGVVCVCARVKGCVGARRHGSEGVAGGRHGKREGRRHGKSKQIKTNPLYVPETKAADGHESRASCLTVVCTHTERHLCCQPATETEWRSAGRGSVCSSRPTLQETQTAVQTRPPASARTHGLKSGLESLVETLYRDITKVMSVFSRQHSKREEAW